MNDNAPDHRNQGAACPYMQDRCHNAAGNYIIGRTEPHKQYTAVPLFGNKQACKLRQQYLEHGHYTITQTAVRKNVKFQQVQYGQRQKRRHANSCRFRSGISVRDKQIHKQHQKNMAYHIRYIFVNHFLPPTDNIPR